MVVAPNGTMVGQPGFARGNVLRGTPGFGDPAMVNLIPPGAPRAVNDIQPTDLMCKSTQTSQTQTDGSPRLQAPAGASVALRYQENGHVTLPQNQAGKPDNRGTVFVYGTTQPSPDDSFLAIHRQWTPDGKGGDGRGVLLSTQNFDDGQCYQMNGGSISNQRQAEFKHTAAQPMGADLWCQQDIALPANLDANKPYTLYWVWDWPTMPGTSGFPNGKQEIYTTCMDIDIVNSGSAQSGSKATVNFQQGQDLNYAGVSSQLADVANPTAVTGKFIAFSGAAAPASAPPPAPAAPSAPAPATTLITSTMPASVLTSSSPAGQSIAFSASATGPAAGQAATESAAGPATTSDPAAFSVHTTSTAGAAGLETQTFSVIPIGASSPTTVPTDFTAAPQQTGQPQFGSGGPGGRFTGMPRNCTHTGRPTGFRTVTIPLY